jgi:hypothetical protein
MDTGDEKNESKYPKDQPPRCFTTDSTEFTEQSANTIADDIAREFTLNSEQSRAYRLVADALVGEVTGIPLDQLRMYVGGEAGSGKTRTIYAIQALFARLRKANWLCTAAFMGSAAEAIGGRTLHSWTGIRRDTQATTTSRARFLSDARFWIVDEVSMMGEFFLVFVCHSLPHLRY